MCTFFPCYRFWLYRCFLRRFEQHCCLYFFRLDHFFVHFFRFAHLCRNFYPKNLHYLFSRFVQTDFSYRCHFLRRCFFRCRNLLNYLFLPVIFLLLFRDFLLIYLKPCFEAYRDFFAHYQKKALRKKKILQEP